MSKFGMGVIYENDSSLKPFIKIDKEYKKLVIEKYYDLYHKGLDKLAEKIVEKYSTCVVVDWHSFSDDFVSKIFNYKDTTDICIGYEKEYSNEKLVKETKEYFEKSGYIVKYNFPYSGSLIPNKYFNEKEKCIESIMIEINKRKYLDNNTDINKTKFDKLKKCVDYYYTNILDKYIKQ